MANHLRASQSARAKSHTIHLCGIYYWYISKIYLVCSWSDDNIRSTRVVLEEYRPEGLTVWTKRSEVRTKKKTEGRFCPSTVPSKLGLTRDLLHG